MAKETGRKESSKRTKQEKVGSLAAAVAVVEVEAVRYK